MYVAPAHRYTTPEYDDALDSSKSHSIYRKGTKQNHN
jgi:hypothetical protein